MGMGMGRILGARRLRERGPERTCATCAHSEARGAHRWCWWFTRRVRGTRGCANWRGRG